MIYTYDFHIGDPTRTHPKRVIKELASEFPSVEFDAKAGIFYPSEDEKAVRALYAEAKRRGFKCSFNVIIKYDHNDALAGELGMLAAGSGSLDARFPKDALDFSTSCPHCGVGAAQVRPHVLNARCIRYKGNFLHGEPATGRVLMRTEIAQEVVEATKQPWCMRHPVSTDGKVVKEWMEPVPSAVMPPLSGNSKGVLFGSTRAALGVETGDPPKIIPPCPVCGRVIWARDYERPMRLAYSHAAIEAAQKHAVVSMYEPQDDFPPYDPVKRAYEYFTLPDLLFNRAALEVLSKYIKPDYTPENIRFLSYIVPVFSE